MIKPLRYLSIATVCAVSSGFGFIMPAAAQSANFFTMKSRASDRCLHVRNGDKPGKAAIHVFDPCQTTPEFRVERMPGENLRIKVTARNFVCLQVKQPLRSEDLPARVTAGNCVAPVSEWGVSFPDADGFVRVTLRRDDTGAAGVCLQERPKSPSTSTSPTASELFVDLCNESSTWKLTRVADPFP